MPAFILRQYLVDRLKTHNVEVAFEDKGDTAILYIRHREFEIKYVRIDESSNFIIANVEFATEIKDYQLLYIYLKKLESIISEFVILSNYMKLERNK